jgi:transcriptional regulator with XRE-family HTH domain
MRKLRQVRQDSRWPEAHVALKKLYDERVRDSLSQEEFGAEYGIGTQGMVWQYLNGYTPLNIEVACRFSEGLRCTISDISPEMDRVMREGILPALGLKSWRRVAALALVSLLPLTLSPSPTDAAQTRLFAINAACVLCQIVKRLISRVKSIFSQFQDAPITERCTSW